MQMKKHLYIALFGLTLWSCSQKQEVQNFKWSAHSPNSSKSSLLSPDARAQSEVPREFLLSETQKVGSLAGFVVYRSAQLVENVPVADTNVVNIRNAFGELQYVSGNAVKHLPPLSSKMRRQLSMNPTQILQRARESFPELKAASVVFPPEAELNAAGNRLSVQWRIGYIDDQHSSAYEIVLNSKGKILQKTKVSSDFTHGKATVFPLGPKQSPIQDVVLRDLKGDGTLSSARIQQSSELGLAPWSPDHVFKYPQNDTRFDEVQTYYFIDHTLHWFKNNYSIELPFPLDVKVHLGGYTNPSNAAFYYRRNIRFGAGDGKIYQGIMRDPSIVMHEVGHAFAEALSKLPMDKGQGASLNEAFADFFAAAILRNPCMGQVAYLQAECSRNLKNSFRFDRDIKNSLYGDSLLVSGIMWEMLERIGEEKAVSLALQTLSRLGPKSVFLDFKEAMIDSMTASSMDESDRLLILSLFESRGWP